jgi:outer membrane receptor protein involved in Fe transport
MAKPLAWGMVLAATAFSTQTFAQAPVEVDGSQPQAAADNAAPEQPARESVDVAMPGGIPTVTVVGRRERDVQRETTQVITVLSNEDIARTGEGDIAGALGRVTGLSVVGDGFVYVRGLGDRYSLALLNGSPLPSPEPMRRAVPLNLFPTDVVASSLVQKTYSPNFPGEFGGGVINLTTLAIPKQSFLDVNFGISGDTETTGRLGYDYYGDENDWTGYGSRNTPPALAAFLDSRQRLSAGGVDTGAIASQLVNADNGLVQTVDEVSPNYSGNITGGTIWQVGESELGVIATAGFSNYWRTRDNIEQTPGSFDLSVLDKDYRKVATENHAVANALLGLGYEFGEGNTLRWTNLYIHDTLKRTSLAEGRQNNQRPGADFLDQTTALYERELLSTQVTGSFNLEPLTVSTRGSYSTSEREAPYELGIGYVRTNQAASPTGGYFINRLDNGQTGYAEIAFSDLDEDLWSAGVDLTAQLMPRLVLSAGVDITDTQRDSTRRAFQIVAPSSFPSGVGMLRPDYLLSPSVVEMFDIGLVETTETDPAFTATLRTEAAYTQLQAEVADGLELSAGVRYERGEQAVQPLQVFDVLTNSGASTSIENDYVLPSATLTYKFQDNMQVRFNASKTIARPQFRELMYQLYFDPEANRAYRGNPLLTDSEFVNAEARYEWYYAADQRFSAAGFYKSIDKPIEAFTGFTDNTPETSFANAPEAVLYGVELEAQKYFSLDEVFGGFFGSRRAVVIGNYTFTDSQINVDAGDTVRVFGTTTQPASNFFTDGSQLTGQSDHLVNLQFGLESPSRLSQQTILLSYASDRVTSRGPAGLPDIYEAPGLRVDFVAREAFELFDTDLEAKLEVRNIFGNDYEEFQERAGNTVYFNRYDIGTTFSASLTMSF